MSCWAIVPAGGKGERAGLGQNKAFYPIRGRSVLSCCLEALSASGRFEGIVLVIAESDEAQWLTLSQREGTRQMVTRIAYGGETRQASVYNGLKMVPEDVDVVAVHDAARPFVSREVIDAVLDSAEAADSGVISTPVTDTIKQIGEDGSVVTLARDSLRAVQTPQAFRRAKLCAAHEKALREGYTGTDDAALYERCWGSVRLVTAPGAEVNRKLTNPDDFERERLPQLRVGTGYDAHRLKEGRRLVLCGVDVPFERGLDGHSDADVAVHALMDALLGAVGEGDIGRHFPDSDPKYEGISSMLLLADVMRLLAERGWSVVNADVTIVAQRPKLAGYLPEMAANLRAALGTDAVNVKATTTERMGFEGEGLGISAQAAVLVGGR